jgi:hypothetical protein
MASITRFWRRALSPAAAAAVLARVSTAKVMTPRSGITVASPDAVVTICGGATIAA